MNSTSTDLVLRNARIADNDAVVGTGLPAGSGLSKADRLAEIIKEPDMVSKIGTAWPLYFRMVLIEGGKNVGTYDQIGLPMEVSGKTVRNWVKALETADILKARVKGHQISIELVGRHMEVAQTRDETVQVMPPEASPMSNLSLRQKVALKLVEVAEETGTKIELKMVI